MAPPEEPQAAAVSVKLPDFWPRNSLTWFAQAEAQFRLAHITADDTKYFNIVAKLDQNTATKISDLLENPPETGKFVALKERLTEAFSPTPLQRAFSLLDIVSLNDRKPSALADDMLAIAGKAISTDCPLFTAIFLRTLPLSVQQHLSTEEKITDFRKFAKRADRLSETAPERNLVHQVREQKVRKSKTDLCWYHARFGSKATKCKQPCQFSQGVRSVEVENETHASQENPGSENGPAGRC